MKAKKKLLKDRIITLRLDDAQDDYIGKAQILLENARGPGARAVSKTEAILVLMTLGMPEFSQRYGNPVKRKD